MTPKIFRCELVRFTLSFSEDGLAGTTLESPLRLAAKGGAFVEHPASKLGAMAAGRNLGQNARFCGPGSDIHDWELVGFSGILSVDRDGISSRERGMAVLPAVRRF